MYMVLNVLNSVLNNENNNNNTDNFLQGHIKKKRRKKEKKERKKEKRRGSVKALNNSTQKSHFEQGYHQFGLVQFQTHPLINVNK